MVLTMDMGSLDLISHTILKLGQWGFSYSQFYRFCCWWWWSLVSWLFVLSLLTEWRDVMRERELNDACHKINNEYPWPDLAWWLLHNTVLTTWVWVLLHKITRVHTLTSCHICHRMGIWFVLTILAWIGWSAHSYWKIFRVVCLKNICQVHPV